MHLQPGFRPKQFAARSKRDILEYVGQLDREAKQFQLAVASETLCQIVWRLLKNQYGAILMYLARRREGK